MITEDLIKTRHKEALSRARNQANGALSTIAYAEEIADPAYTEKWAEDAIRQLTMAKIELTKARDNARKLLNQG